jgi:tetratricopeptide (TPR) repeat protein
MNSPSQKQAQGVRMDQKALPPPKWWGHYVLDGKTHARRFVIRWSRIATVVGAASVVLYVALVTSLWGYYSIKRKIPGVNWIDIAVLPRFSHVQAAIGASYFAEAKAKWEKGDYVQAVFTGRAAVQKSPANLDARLFLAGCWLKAGRTAEAIRTLRDGVEFNADDPRLQQAAVGACLETAHFQDLLKLLHEDFPSHGAKLLEQHNADYELADVRAVLETSGAPAAAATVSGYPDLSTLPRAAPMLASIDVQLGRIDAALARLKAAADRDATNPEILGAYAEIAKHAGRMDLAKDGARRFIAADPRLVAAQLCFLEMFGSRKGEDQQPWIAACMAYLTLHRHEPDAMAQLSSVAASQGWDDLAFLTYENSLQEDLNGMPFAIYYAASLVRSGHVAEADSVWHQLALRNGKQLSSASYVGAMIAWAAGRQSEAMQILDNLRHETANDPARLRSLEALFRDYGFPKIADQLAADRA